jgi:DNA-binding beta-propeller fold protein YncE
MQRTLRDGSKGALLMALALALACLAAAPAHAAPRTIAGFGEGTGKVFNPRGVAVDPATGDLYVADRNNRRIDKFGSDGRFLLSFGYSVADGSSETLQVCGPAAEPPTGRCFAKLNPGNNIEPKSVAVGGEGDVYVLDGQRMSKFTASGTLVYMRGRDVNKTRVAEGATQAERDICTAVSGDACGAGLVGSGKGEFSFPGSVAVGPADVIWVGGTERLQAFEADGTPGEELAVSGGSVESLALDSTGNFYLISSSLPGIRKLHPDGTAFGSPFPLDESGQPLTVALDEAGDVYVGDCNTPTFPCPYSFKVYDPAGEQTSQFGAGQVIGEPKGNAIAVDDGGGVRPPTLYSASSRSGEGNSAVQAFPIPEPGPLPEGERAEAIEPATATLAATLNPEGHETAYHFEYDTSPYAEGEEGHGTRVPASGPDPSLPAGFEDAPVQAPLEGLIPDTTYHFRLCATSEVATVCGLDASFKTRTGVGIEAQWASDVAARSATLHARLNPLGVKADWWLEYGASPCSEGGCVKAVEGHLPESFEETPAAVALSGLGPATTYHYRFAASDVRDGVPRTTYGEERTFTTQLAGLGFTLPDSRAWEMVSPADKHGGRIAAPDGAQGGQVQAAADGEALAYLSYGSLEENPEGNRLIEQSSELARRAPAGAWGTTDITPPHTTVTPFGPGSGLEYKLLSSNLERALLQPRECTPLSPAASERTPYLRENGEPPTYVPLVTSREGFADVPEGTPPFGGNCAKPGGPVNVQGASADLGHAVLGSAVSLATGAASVSLYEWTAGGLQPISVPPGEGTAVKAELGSGVASVRGAVSTDGSRVFWTGGGLYLRETARGETIQLDEVRGGFGAGQAAPLFQGASADGSAAFFTDTQSLTPETSEEGADLYRWRAQGVEGCGEASGCLEDLSAQTQNPEDPFESAKVFGLLPGFGAEDGLSAFFLARGVVANNSVDNGAGPEAATPGQPNLYAWRAGEGVRFVATLSGEDERDWGSASPLASNLTATASPNGRYLAFMSKRPLTGYDNRAVGSGERVQEVFRYDAATGALACASCNPSGARPRALVPGRPPAGQLAEEFDPQLLWKGQAVAAVVPEATEIQDLGPSLYAPRYLQDDGRLFFNAADSLVPADSNGDGDVYEYESTGTGACTASSGDTGTAIVPGGCVSLISSGTAGGTSAFLDASEGARDVFFYSPARLSVTDTDSELDVYDAREEGVPATLRPSAECLGEACQPPATPRQTQTPASAAFRGPGNPHNARKRCPKGRRKARRHGRVRCVKKRRHRRHHRHHRRHSHRNGRNSR